MTYTTRKNAYLPTQNHNAATKAKPTYTYVQLTKKEPEKNSPPPQPLSPLFILVTCAVGVLAFYDMLPPFEHFRPPHFSRPTLFA